MHSTRLQVVCNPEFSEILIAEIGEVGFNTFLETETGFEAFIEGDGFDQEQLNQLLEKYKES